MKERGHERVAAAAALAVIALGLAAWPYTVDDAYVVSRYARRLATGLGWTFVDGPPTDGVTGPLWMLPAWLGEMLGLGAPVLQKATGLAAAAAGAWWLARHAGWPAALVLATQSTLAIWGVAGLETGAAVLLGAVAAVAARPGARGRRSEWQLGASLGLLAWVRPELAPFAAVLLVAKGSRRAWALAASLALALIVFRVAMFGSPWPLPMLAKPADLGSGATYVARAVIFTTGLAGLPLAFFGARQRGRALGLAIVAQLLTLAVAGGDWMPGWRLVAPLLPGYALLCAAGYRTFPACSRVPRWYLGLACLAGLLDAGVQLPAVRDAGAARRAAAPLAAEVGALESVALVDVGYLTWRSDVHVFDLGGITEPVVARAEGGHLDKAIPLGWLAEEPPEVVLVHASVPPRVDDEGRLETLAGYPVERELAASRWLRAHYRHRRDIAYSPGYLYVWLERRPSADPRALPRTE